MVYTSRDNKKVGRYIHIWFIDLFSENMKWQIIIWMIILKLGSTGGLTERECEQLTDPRKCELSCANRLCMNRRFNGGGGELKCLRETLPIMPADEIAEMKKEPMRQVAVLRRFFTIMAYMPERIQRPVSGNQYLLEHDNSKYSEILKTYFPINEFVRDRRFVGRDCAAQDRYIPMELSYRRCSLDLKECPLIKKIKLDVIKEFREKLKNLNENQVVYQLGFPPVYNFDPDLHYALNMHSMIEDHLAEALAQEIKKRIDGESVMNKKLEELEKLMTELKQEIVSRGQSSGGPGERGPKGESGTPGTGSPSSEEEQLDPDPVITDHSQEDNLSDKELQISIVNDFRKELGDLFMEIEEGVVPDDMFTNYDDLYYGLDGGSGITPTRGSSRDNRSAMDIIKETAGTLRTVNLAKNIARILLRDESKYLEKRIGDHVDNSLTIAGELLLQSIKPMFEQITTKGMEISRKQWMKMVEEKLEKHPLFMNKKKYQEAINITKEELKVLLAQISYDPVGQYGLSGLIAASITGLCSIICTIIACKWGKTHFQMSKMRAEIRDQREERREIRSREI